MAGPTFCWHCGKKLRLPHYVVFKDGDGNEHRVHKVCLDDAKESNRKKTVELANLAAYHGDIDGDFDY